VLVARRANNVAGERLYKDMQKRPDAYGINGGYREFAAFVNDCNSATAGPPLDGFSAHQAERLGSGGNLDWAVLVTKLRVYPDEIRRVDDVPVAAESRVISRIFTERLEFLTSHDSRDAMAN